MHVEGLLVIEIKWKNVFSHMILVNIELIDKVILKIYSCVCATIEQTKIMARNGKYSKYRYKCFYFCFFFFRIAKLAWENVKHFATHSLVSLMNTEILY